jgi:short subunit dehydrogenase-like uncharacterized protein
VERDFDVVLYGASGFTGRQTVQYFSQFAPRGLHWAVAGRNREKLEGLKANVPSLVADTTNQQQLEGLASRTRVLLTTAGPFALCGNGLVDACVKFGTHYADITGETAWVRSLIDRHHEKALLDGTRIIPCCGFDSVPADLGVSVLLDQLGPNTTEVKACFEIKGGRPNGGTVASGIHAFSSGSTQRMRDPFLLSPGKRRDLHPLEKDPSVAAFDKDLNVWVAPFPTASIDTRVVRRSCGLSGIDFAFQEYMTFSGVTAPLQALAMALGSALVSKAMAAPFFREMVTRSAQPGSGPNPEVMDAGWFRCRIWGKTSDGRTAEVTVAGKGDPANRITVKCLCESALCLSCDAAELPGRGGILTPSTGLGKGLVRRLRTRGIEFTAH